MTSTMARMTIDQSTTLVVVVCHSCAGHWRACAWTTAEAYDSAVRHELRTHPGEEHARAAREQWQRRQRRRNTPNIR